MHAGIGDGLEKAALLWQQPAKLFHYHNNYESSIHALCYSDLPTHADGLSHYASVGGIR